jgi:hypothetical protein
MLRIIARAWSTAALLPFSFATCWPDSKRTTVKDKTPANLLAPRDATASAASFGIGIRTLTVDDIGVYTAATS